LDFHTELVLLLRMGGAATYHTGENPERCTRQSALIAAMNVKFHSNLIRADQSTAENVGRREEVHAEDINIKAPTDRLSSFFIKNFIFYSSSESSRYILTGCPY